MCPSAKSETNQKAKGRVFIIPDRCKGCGFCIQFCPGKVLGFSKDFNAKGYHPPVIAFPEKCVGCNLCGLFCPDFAIYAVRKGAAQDQDKEALDREPREMNQEEDETMEGREEE